MAEFVYALSNGDKGTPVKVSADFAKSAGLKVVDDPNEKKSSGGSTASSKEGGK